jgi:hypothetical protein
MLWWISIAITLTASWLGYGTARRFVRDRLRYVDAAQSSGAPIIAGVVAAMVIAPIAWLLPLVTAGTALAVGISVALGVRAGATDVKRGYLVSSGG